MDSAGGDDQPDPFRAHLIAADQTASRDYDKALLTLSAGSLGVSIAFIHTVAPHPKDIWWLGAAWGLFAVSLICVVSSLLTSQHELRSAITKYDNKPDETSTEGACSSITAKLNVWAGVAFLLGVVALVVFAFLNLKGK